MRCAALAVALLLAAFACPVTADEIIFKNGDRLTGEIQTADDGTLTINSWSAGTVTVELEKVRTISTDAPVAIHFRDGTVISRRIVPSDEGRFAIEREGVLQPQVFAIADVTAINPPGAAEPAWKGDVTAGFTITRSSTDTESANLSVGMVRETEADRITLDAALLYGRQESPDTGDRTTTEDSWSANAKYDYFLSEHVFVYGNSGIKRDDILDLDLRLIVGAGIGREWVKRDDFAFRTEGGLSWLYEDFANETETSEQITARLAYHVAKRINRKLEITHDLAWYPAFEDFGDYFLTTEVEIRVSLTEAMYGDFKVLWDYDSTPAVGADKGSLKSILGLGVSF